MNVRAKFFVKAKTLFSNGKPEDPQAGEIVLAPVFGSYASGDPNKINASWSRWTPSGEIKMSITNPDALNVFGLGQEFYVDFTPAED